MTQTRASRPLQNLSVFLLKRQKRATLSVPTLSHQTAKNAKRDRKRQSASPAAQFLLHWHTPGGVPDAFPGHPRIAQVVAGTVGTHAKKTTFCAC